MPEDLLLSGTEEPTEDAQEPAGDLEGLNHDPNSGEELEATDGDSEGSEEASPYNIPGEDATPEEIKAYHKALGVPENIEGYNEVFNREDVEWGEVDPIKEAALKEGVTPKQLSGIMDAYLGVIGNYQQKLSTDATTVNDSLRGEWGRDYDTNLGLAIQTAKSFGGDTLMKSLASTGLGNDKELIKTFSSIGKALASEGIIDGSPVGRMSRKDTEAKAQELMASEAYMNPRHASHDRTVAEVTRLFSLAYPEPPKNNYV